MHGADFLRALTIVLCVAAVTTVLFHRLRQPVVLGYVLAGLIIGPHVPIPLVADPAIVHTLSELGVILLMFSLGLEFSIGKLIRVGPTAGVTALIQCSVMLWLGFMAGQLLGWTAMESIFAGAIIAISSTTIIAKAFDEQKVSGRLREIVVGVLIVEDMIAIVLMAILTGVSTGAGLSAAALARTLAELAGFLATLLVVGLLVVPRAMRAVVRLGRPETTLVASIGLCFGVALLAHAFGYSVALGAFIAGSLVAESGEGERVEHLVAPVRDMFAAVFFVSVGMLIDPAIIAQHAVAIVLLTVVVILGKIGSVTVGAFLTGAGTRTSVAAGMSLAQIGEFSFIIASLGLSLDATGPHLYPIAVAVSAITTLTTPWMIRGSGPAAAFVDRKLPRAAQTFAALYASWLERMRAHGGRQRGPIRRAAGTLAIDVAAVSGVVIAAALSRGRAPDALLVVGAVVLSAPFLVGIYRVSRTLGARLAAQALPAGGDGKLDLATAPRRALLVTLQLGCVLAAGLPIVALTQPFVPSGVVALIFGGVLLVLGVALWRNATSLELHVRAGAQLIIEVLAAQTQHGGAHELHPVRDLLPGIGEPEAITLDATSPAVGQTLAALNLRGATGATVLALRRAAGDVLVPTPTETLEAGDVLAVAGSQEAIAAARVVLTGEG